MAKSNRKRQEEAERQRLDEIEARERDGAVAACVFCQRPAMHDKSHSLHKRMKWEKHFDDAVICLQCHSELHRIAKQRSQKLDSVEVAMAEESFQKYLNWASKRPPETMYH